MPEELSSSNVSRSCFVHARGTDQLPAVIEAAVVPSKPTVSGTRSASAPLRGYAARYRASCRGMPAIRFLEERQQPFDVIGLFQKVFRVPLTVCCREEVAAIHVNRSR